MSPSTAQTEKESSQGLVPEALGKEHLRKIWGVGRRGEGAHSARCVWFANVLRLHLGAVFFKGHCGTAFNPHRSPVGDWPARRRSLNRTSRQAMCVCASRF